MLQSVDFREFNQILSVTPGENNIPLSIFLDKYSEFLAFPGIYCGEARPYNSLRLVPLHYSTICKWELRNIDRRCANCIPNLFYKLKKLQIKQIQDKVMLAIRKCKLNGKKYTAAQVLDSHTADSIVRLNEGFQVLRNLRGSPPYWEKAKKDIFAMIRQLGLPTWFCSFSAAETKWIPLLRCLGELIENVSYSDDEILNMSWEHKSKLIKADPVTCARYFDFRFSKFFTEVLGNDTHPVGQIKDSFYRIEFQQRCSPHVHMLLWIKDAPNILSHEYQEVAEFINKYVSCNKDGADPSLVNYQTHRHARTCMKKNKPICRFNFPIPPMPFTMILSPLNEEDENIASAVLTFQEICAYLNSQAFKGSELSFQEFLSNLNLDLETYIQAIRSSLKQNRVFLKRSPNEVRINAYNPILLKCWQANMDIQFILDPYACAVYIVSYISKGQRGMSNLLRHACEEARTSNSDIRQQVRRIGNKFLSHVEVGAQEAVYIVLQMPLRHSSRGITFVNTSPPEERVVLIKPRHVLEELQEDSTDIESGNIVTLYQQRPRALEGLCLADFVSQFYVKYKPQKNKNPTSEEYLPENDDNDMSEDQESNLLVEELSQSYIFRNGVEIVKRKKPCVLRWVHFDKETDPEKYYRELLMLFTHWRKEDKDLLKSFNSFEESFKSAKGQIEKKQEEYEKKGVNLDDVEAISQYMDDNTCSEYFAPGCEHQEQMDKEGPTMSEAYGCIDPGKHAPEYDIGLELGIARKQLDEDISQLGELDDNSYRDMLRNLNVQQKECFNHVLHWHKTKTDPMYVFLTGGAGVGKSVVTRALYQALLK